MFNLLLSPILSVFLTASQNALCVTLGVNTMDLIAECRNRCCFADLDLCSELLYWLSKMTSDLFSEIIPYKTPAEFVSIWRLISERCLFPLPLPGKTAVQLHPSLSSSFCSYFLHNLNLPLTSPLIPGPWSEQPPNYLILDCSYGYFSLENYTQCRVS